MGFIDKLFGSKKDKKDMKTQEKKEVQIEKKIHENNAEKTKNEETKHEEKKISENELLLNILKDKISPLNLQVNGDNEKVVIPEIDTSIKAVIKGKNQQNNALMVQIDFFIQNKGFGEEGIYESLAGIGKDNNIEEAISSCVDIFIKTVFNVVVEALKGNHNSNLNIETKVDGIARTWHTYIGTIQTQGFDNLEGIGNNHIYNLLKDQIVKRLRNKRYYWIKVLITSHNDGKLMYQCLLNNKPFLEAERVIDEYVKGWPEGGNNRIESQYIVIRQSDKSFTDNRQKDIEKENFIKECTQYAISVFENYGPEDSVEGLVNKISEFTKDINLAWELFWFIPAIYCRLVLSGPNYTDTVILVLPDDRRIFGKLYDYEAYVVGVDIVIKKLQDNQSQENIKKILFLSEEFKALQKLLKEGSNAKDLQPVPMVLMAPRSYIVSD
ncbi:MAG: hypothetical protein GX270_03600 [Clostridiaceae bacterium]|nr:hypothetical protein [Clostridiaceae bacterium]